MADGLSIRRLIERITSGDIRIPAFQRDFVWEPEQVAFLLDSIYKNFPIGTVILWRTDTRLPAEKNLGSYQLPEPQKDYPVNYVLDGQQRLTSLFSTFQTELEPMSSDWVDVFFDVGAEERIQESLFVPLAADEVDPSRHFPVKTIFNPLSFHKATQGLQPDNLERITLMASRFWEYNIPNEIFDSADRHKVAIVFERINRAGTELNVFELLSAWSWSEDFDLVEKFHELQEEIASHGYEDLVADKDLQLRVCAAVISGETTPAAIMGLSGEDIREKFEEIRNGIIGAIDFLRDQIGVKHFNLLPFPGILVPMACFFATTKQEGERYSDKQRRVIERWFWRSVFNRRFSSGVNERQAHDIVEMVALRREENHAFRLPRAEIKIDLYAGNFSASNANSKALILLLNTQNPKSFWSGQRINIDKVLRKGSQHEYHHIFPQAFLRNQGIEQRDINCLANICFLTRGDNNAIRNKSPKEYLKRVSEDVKNEFLSSAFCPFETESMEYGQFRKKCEELLTQKANELMS